MIAIGDFIQVKDGILDPDDEKFDMTGWKGVVRGILDEDDLDETLLLLEIDWDVDTLNNLPSMFIENSLEEGVYFDKMNLWSNEVFLITKEQVNLHKVLKTVQEIVAGLEAADFNEEEKHYAVLLASNNIDVCKASLRTYRKYLLDNLEQPVYLKGVEPFAWEKPFLFGERQRSEYEFLKKKYPSYKDEFTLMKIFNANVGDECDLIAKVKRKSDNKVFKLELSDLESIDEKSPNFKLLDKYANWASYY